MFKKVLSLAVCLCMLLGAISTVALAAPPVVSAVAGLTASHVEFTDGTSVVTAIPASGAVTAKVKVTNSGAAAQNAVLMVGVYANDVLTSMSFDKQSVAAGATTDFAASLTGVAAGSELKAYVWNGFDASHAIAYPATFPSADCTVLAIDIDGVRVPLVAGTKTYNVEVPGVSTHTLTVVTADNGTYATYPAIIEGMNPITINASNGTTKDTYTLNLTSSAAKITNITRGDEVLYSQAPNPGYSEAVKLTAGGQLYAGRINFAIGHVSQALVGAERIILALDDARRNGLETDPDPVRDYMRGDNVYFTFDVNAACEVFVLAPWDAPNFNSRPEWVKVNNGTGIDFSGGIVYNGTTYTDQNSMPLPYNPSTPEFYMSRAQMNNYPGMPTVWPDSLVIEEPYPAGATITHGQLNHVYRLIVTGPGTVTIPTPGVAFAWADNMVVAVKWGNSSATPAPTATVAPTPTVAPTATVAPTPTVAPTAPPVGTDNSELETFGIKVDGVDTNIGFDSKVFQYNIMVPEGTTSVTIDPKAFGDGTVEIKGGGNTITSFPAMRRVFVYAEDSTSTNDEDPGYIGTVYYLTINEEKSTNTKVVATNETGNPGDTVTVTLNMTQNPGIGMFTFGLAYDQTLFKCTAIRPGYLAQTTPPVNAGTFGFALAANIGALSSTESNIRKANAGWLNPTGFVGDGSLFEADFEILAGTPDGVYELPILFIADIFDNNYDLVPVTPTNGSITVGSGAAPTPTVAPTPTPTVAPTPTPTPVPGAATNTTYDVVAAGMTYDFDAMPAGGGSAAGPGAIVEYPASSGNMMYKWSGTTGGASFSPMQVIDNNLAGGKSVFTADLIFDTTPGTATAGYFFFAARDGSPAEEADGLWKWNANPRWLSFAADGTIALMGEALDVKWTKGNIQVEIYFEPCDAPGNVNDGVMIAAVRGDLADATTGAPRTIGVKKVNYMVPRSPNQWSCIVTRWDETAGSQAEAIYIDNFYSYKVNNYTIVY